MFNYNFQSLKRLQRHFIIAVNSLWALPLLILLRLIQPLYPIKIIKIRSDRIGHFVLDSLEVFCRYSKNNNGIKYFFFIEEPISNYYWEKLVKRKLKISPFSRYIYKLNQLLFNGALINELSTLTDSRDIKGLYFKNNIEIPFSEHENEIGLKWLRSLGWREGEKFACLIVRDSSYLDKTYNQINWDYHKYRNSDIKTYEKSLRWLSEKGVWVIRMGKHVEKRVSYNSHKIIDYSHNENKSDFLDIWLFANCDFCISTSTGIDCVSQVYKKPILYLNALPLIHFCSYSICFWYPKNLFWKNNIPLSLNDYLENSYTDQKNYDINEIKIIDMSEDEILIAVKEFWFWFKNNRLKNKQRYNSQIIFWERLKNHNDTKSFHDWKHKDSYIGYNWLKTKL